MRGNRRRQYSGRRGRGGDRVRRLNTAVPSRGGFRL